MKTNQYSRVGAVRKKYVYPQGYTNLNTVNSSSDVPNSAVKSSSKVNSIKKLK